MLYFGPLREEFMSDTVSYSVIENNGKLIPISPHKEKEFPFIDYTTYQVSKIMITSSTTNISSKVLDQLLLRWLVNPDGMDSSESGIADKIKLLLKVSSIDFWAKNYFIHPKQDRVSWWLWSHKRYLHIVKSLQNIPDRESLLSAFKKISKRLQTHSHYEEIMLYPFIKNNYEEFQLAGTSEELKNALDSLTKEHIPIQKQEDDIVNKFMDKKNSLSDMKKLILKWQHSLEEHFEWEEQTIVHILLKFDNSTNRRYMNYFSWGYVSHIMESFIDYVLNLFYIID